MLDGGFFAAALSLIGIAPSRQLPPVLEGTGPSYGRNTPIGSPRLSGLESSAVKSHLRLVDNAIPTRTFAFDAIDSKRPLKTANTRSFVKWMREIDECGEISQRRLLSLYFEFCDNAFHPVTTRQLLLQIASCGVEKRRLSAQKINGKLHSPTVYQVRVSQKQRRAA